jgi:tetratricopeptide (TPR) repeat protein
LAVDRSKVLQQAQLLASRGQYDAAIAEWKKLAAESPNDGSIHNSIGDLHLKRNAGAEATTAFMQAAAAFRAAGATLKAIAAFKKVLKIDPTCYEVYRHLGDLNAERGLLSSAVQDYLTLGKQYLKEGKGKQALEIYQKIVSQDPSNMDAQQRVAELCVQENLQDEATKVYLQLGRERSAQGRYDEAKDAYVAVLRIDPKNSEAVQFVESLQKGGIGGAAPLKSSTTVVQKSSEPLDLLAEATRRIEERQFAGAEAILNQLLTREPGNPQVCQLLARLHLQRGDVQVALGEYRFLAGAALRAQDYLLAEALIGEFLSIEPHSVPLLELYGELLAERGDAAAAAQQYALAVELLLQNPEPGMESLHEELFDKVKTLSTDSELVSRLAAKMRGESPLNIAAPPAAERAAAQPKIEASQVHTAQNDVLACAVSQAEKPQEQSQRHAKPEFSLVGATPDEAIVLDGPMQPRDLMEGAYADLKLEPEHGLLSEPPPPTSLVDAPCGTSAASALSLNESADDQGALLRRSEHILTPQEPEVVQELMPEPELVREPQPELVPDPPVPVDYESHFTLGVAYKNMGLYVDAKDEFQVSQSGEAFYVDSCLMIALCLKEEHLLPEAIQELEAVLSDPRCQGAKGQALRYELGLLYEGSEQWGKAAHTYQTIPSFHDVPQRLQSLKGRAQPAASEFRLAGSP